MPLALLCSWNVLKAVRRLGNPDAHPLAKTLVKYGDPEEIAAQIEEQSAAEDVEVIGGVTLTRSWLLRPKTFGVDLMHLGDAAWVYKMATKHYHNGIPTGTTYSAVLCDIHGEALSAQMSEPLCDEFAAAVAARVPWVLIGFDPNWEQLWKKNKAAIYEMVEERRLQFAEHIRRQKEEGGAEPMDVEPAD